MLEHLEAVFFKVMERLCKSRRCKCSQLGSLGSGSSAQPCRVRAAVLVASRARSRRGFLVLPRAFYREMGGA